MGSLGSVYFVDTTFSATARPSSITAMLQGRISFVVPGQFAWETRVFPIGDGYLNVQYWKYSS
jgi:hypothetical protein